VAVARLGKETRDRALRSSITGSVLNQATCRQGTAPFSSNLISIVSIQASLRNLHSVGIRIYGGVISPWHSHCRFVSNWNFRIQFETRRRRDMLFEPGGVSFCDNPPAQPWGTKKPPPRLYSYSRAAMTSAIADDPIRGKLTNAWRAIASAQT